MREGDGGGLNLGNHAMRFHLPSALRKWAGDREVIEISLPLDLRMTIVEAIEMLGRDYPGIRQRVLDDQGNIRRHVNVFVDGENIRFTQGNATQVTHASEVRIYPAISGGT
jgi:molybdopterin converting factor small subunit